MNQFLVAIVSGLAVGAVYALLGLGIVLAYRATATFNFAHGELMIFPAFVVGYWVTQGVMPALAAAAIALVGIMGVGALFYRLVLQRTIGMPHWTGFIASLGLASIIQGVVGLWFGSANYNYDLPLLGDGATTVFGVRVASAWLVLAVVGILVTGGVAAALRFTAIGASVRASGQDALLASQGGINVSRVFLASWALAALLAGLAGVLFASTNVVSLELAAIAWAAIPAVVLGGLDSVEGSIIGGLVIGVIQGLGSTYLGGGTSEMLTYSILLLVLLIRPRGLLGTKEVTRL